MKSQHDRDMQSSGANFPPAAMESHPERERERDPEEEWKSRPQPWASAGWGQITGHDGSGNHIHGNGGGRSFWSGFGRAFLTRALLAAVLFAAVWGMFSSDEPWALAGQSIVRDGLTRQMDFAAAEEWYRTLFAGSPTFIPIFKNGDAERVNAAAGTAYTYRLPVREGVIVRPFPQLRNGVEIAPPGGGDGAVLAADTGRVLLVSTGEGTGVTVVVQHAGGRTTIYGQLQSASVAVNDWVEAGGRIGLLPSAATMAPGHLYFAAKENGRYVDPADRLPHG